VSLHNLLLIAALILFVLEALGKRTPIKAPFGMLGGGLACLTAAFIF
jgi:hypothetical protein